MPLDAHGCVFAPARRGCRERDRKSGFPRGRRARRRVASSRRRAGPLPANGGAARTKATRQQARVLGDRVLGSGFATLTYDKARDGSPRPLSRRQREEFGPRRSTNSPATWSRSRDGSRPARGGFGTRRSYGASRAGWIIPLAAEREPRIRSGVAISGPAVTGARSRTANSRVRIRFAEGLGDEEIGSAPWRALRPRGIRSGSPCLNVTRLAHDLDPA